MNHHSDQYTTLAVSGGNRTQLSYLWKRGKLSLFIKISVHEFVFVFCDKDWLIFNCWWTKRISEALQSQEARSGHFWLGSNNFLLHPGSGRIIRLPESGSGTLRHSGARASGMLHYNLLWTLERRGFHDIVAIYADFSSLWCGPLYKFTYSK